MTVRERDRFETFVYTFIFDDFYSYDIMLSCWNEDPDNRPDFGKLGQALNCLLNDLPALEASQEAIYMNRVLEVSAGAAGFDHAALQSGGGWNLRDSAAAGGLAVRNEYVDLDDGYLKCITGSVKDS